MDIQLALHCIRITLKPTGDMLYESIRWRAQGGEKRLRGNGKGQQAEESGGNMVEETRWRTTNEGEAAPAKHGGMEQK